MNQKSKTTPIAYSYNVDRYQKAIPQITWRSLLHSMAKRPILMEELNRPSTPICINPIQLYDLPDYCKNQFILPLENHFSKSELAHYFSPALDICRVNGKLMAIPEDFSPYLLFARHDLLEKHDLKPAVNFSEFNKQLTRLKKATGKPPLTVQGGGPKARLGFICAVLGVFGVDLSGSLESWDEYSDKMIEAYEWIHELYQKDLIANFDLFIRQLPTIDKKMGPFSNEAIYTTAWLNFEILYAQEVVSDKIHVSSMFSSHAKSKAYQLLSGHGWIVPAKTQNPDLAIEVLKKAQHFDLIKGNELQGGAPFNARRDIWKDPQVLAKHPFYQWHKILQEDRPGFLINPSDRKLKILDESFRNSLRDNLKGSEWLRSLLTSGFTTSRKVATNSLIQKSLDFMEQNFGKIQNTKDIASHLGMNPNYFTRLFQKSMNIGCGEYLMRIRMEKARELLHDKRLSIKEIADQVGFRHPQGFTRAFRKYWKKSPSEAGNSTDHS